MTVNSGTKRFLARQLTWNVQIRYIGCQVTTQHERRGSTQTFTPERT